MSSVREPGGLLTNQRVLKEGNTIYIQDVGIKCLHQCVVYDTLTYNIRRKGRMRVKSWKLYRLRERGLGQVYGGVRSIEAKGGSHIRDINKGGA